MYCLEKTKPDGRALRLYSRRPIVGVGPAPSPDPTSRAGDSHLRWQPLRGEWIAYAPHRQSQDIFAAPGIQPAATHDGSAFPN